MSNRMGQIKKRGELFFVMRFQDKLAGSATEKQKSGE